MISATVYPTGGYGAYSYSFVSEPLNWDNAGEACANTFNGHLAWIVDADENAYIGSFGFVGWIGGKEDASNFWSSGDTSTYKAWNEGEPSSEVENCVQMVEGSV